MTISELFDHITESVVPETVLPQNIASCLMDENADIPELDAFTFLNRLRDLGIGSADFIYLLKSCGAPAEAVEKIENNPAMSLQGLIVTLEHAGIEPRDYTRMLYSARKIWERTQTMRISVITEQLEASEQSEDARRDTAEALSAERDEKSESKAEPEPAKADAPAEAPGELSIGGRLKGITVLSGEEITEVHKAEPSEEKEASAEKPAGVCVKGIAASACGAAVLFGLCAVMSAGIIPVKSRSGSELHFAADAREVFSEIYYAYNSGVTRGENVVEMPSDTGRVFSGMLVEPTGTDKGVFTIGDCVYSAYSNRVRVYDRESCMQTSELVPPEGCEFIELFERGDLYAVYSGKKSGVIRLTGSEFNAELCGTLTDYTISGTTAALACVYFPEFTENFKIGQTERYLPFTVINGETRSVPAERVVLGAEKNACGYAVSVTIDLASGEITDSAAVLGDAQFSDSDGAYAVVRTDVGSQIISFKERITDEKTALIYACDYSDGVLCTVEAGDEPAAYIRGDDLKAGAAMRNFTEQVTSAEIDGGYLYISGENGIFTVAELSDGSPQALNLQRRDGIISGEYALVGGINGSEVSFVLYNGDGSEAARCSKVIAAESLSDFKLSGANTFIIESGLKCGAAYSYFDGVSFVSEFAQLGSARKSSSMYDDRTGYIAAFSENDSIRLIYSNGSATIN